MSSIGNIRPLTGHIGAEISGVDVNELDEAGIEFIEDAFHQHQVLFFPRQRLNPDQLVSFAERFGDIQPPPNGLQSHPDNPMVVPFKTDKGIGAGKYNEAWHTDLSFHTRPPSVSILHALKMPELGGDTLYASMYAAYEALSEPFKQLVDGLEALHDGLPSYALYLSEPGIDDGAERLNRMKTQEPGAVHPVVRRHPKTGRKALYVNRVFTARILGVSEIESRALLSLLYEHVEQPRFQLRWRWDDGDLAMWDNRCAMHHASLDYGHAHRLVHRVTLTGERPSA